MFHPVGLQTFRNELRSVLHLGHSVIQAEGPSGLTLHEDGDDVQELLHGQVSVAVLVGQREHGLDEEGAGLEAQGAGELLP